MFQLSLYSFGGKTVSKLRSELERRRAESNV